MTVKSLKKVSDGPTKVYRLGVDVGGTNTDSVLVCAHFEGGLPDGNRPRLEVVASYKTPTTRDVTSGIETAVEGVLGKTSIMRSEILSLNVGTTHFINAIIESDATKLSRVAVLRLCGPFCRDIPPFEEFPKALSSTIKGHIGYLQGGREIDGRPIGTINEQEVLEHVEKIHQRGDQAVAVVGVFSPLDVAAVSQEETVKNILQNHLPGVDVVLSRDVGSLGFIERENATILNASILRYGRKIIGAFQRAKSRLGLNCPLYISQNDGTILGASAATSLPIKTFSSGATNSLTGASFLANMHSSGKMLNLENEQVIVIDIGGTSSDFAALTPSGFPRQCSAVVKVGGVRTAFSMPEVLCLGLGGGSRVTIDDEGSVLVGPESVGYQLQTKSQCFGGTVLTATDVAVASGRSHSSIQPKWQGVPDPSIVSAAQKTIARTLMRGIELMKTSDQPVVALLVGGGSFIQVDDLKNVQRCVRPPFHDVANAVGAAIAKIAGEVDCIQVPGSRSREQIVEDMEQQAAALALENGAHAGTVRTIEVEVTPLAYMDNGAVRVRVKAVGDLSWKIQGLENKFVGEFEPEGSEDEAHGRLDTHHGPNPEEAELDLMANQLLESYRPTVLAETAEWLVSETDLAFISEGVGVLGTGGGGSVRSTYLECVKSLRFAGFGKLKIVDPKRVPLDGRVAMLAWTGSPSVSNERLSNCDELLLAMDGLKQFRNDQSYDAVMGPEIGGANGMCAFPMAAALGVPIVDADTMGRAFPKVDMALPYVHGVAVPWPAAFSDARRNVQIVASAQDANRFESMGRSICVELGSSAAMVLNPLTGKNIQEFCCPRGLSTAWFIGRQILLARQKNKNPAEAVLSVTGGRLLYTGKVTAVERSETGGWTVGMAIVEPNDEVPFPSNLARSENRPLVLKFQNEFLCAELSNSDGSNEAVCTVPDLICVLDQDGSGLETHELRYGLLVQVIAMPAHPLWKTDQGMKIGGPGAFSLGVVYTPCGSEYRAPASVIETYSQ